MRNPSEHQQVYLKPWIVKVCANMMVLTFFTYVGLSTILAQSGFSHALSIRAPDNYTSPYPNPEPCEGNCSWIHDPSIFYEDGKYWRFSTSGNIAVATAQSFEGPWEYEGALLSSGTSINVSDSQDIWASVHYVHMRMCELTMSYRPRLSQDSATLTTVITLSRPLVHRILISVWQRPILSNQAHGGTEVALAFLVRSGTTKSTRTFIKKTRAARYTSCLAATGQGSSRSK